MSVVGSFPFGRPNRAVRTPPNPMDKSTIVSIYPMVINEKKATIQPGQFRLEAGSLERPAILVIGSSSWWRDVDEGQDQLEIPTSSVLVADSVVKDYCNGTLECVIGIQQPGIFFVPGEFTVLELKKTKNALLLNADLMQRRWYEALIKLGDSLWARSQGNPLSIDDRMRMAARALGKDKPWIKDFQSVELVNCTLCGALRNPKYPVCHSCNRVVDTALAKELGIPV